MTASSANGPSCSLVCRVVPFHRGDKRHVRTDDLWLCTFELTAQEGLATVEGYEDPHKDEHRCGDGGNVLDRCGRRAGHSGTAWNEAGPFQRFATSTRALRLSGAASGDIIVVDGSGSGIATHLGRFTLTWNFIVNLADGTGSGPVSFIAANGDVVFITALGQSEPTDTPGVFHIVEIQTITGGTGRFAGAQGSFIVDRLIDLNTGFTSGSFHGTITSPGAAR